MYLCLWGFIVSVKEESSIDDDDDDDDDDGDDNKIYRFA